MSSAPLPLLGVSSWSLHRTIGRTWWDAPDGHRGARPQWGDGSVAMLDLPALVARHGITNLHLCHFHVVSQDRAWVDEFRSALDAAGVTLTMLLIDDGDIADPAHAARDVRWTAGWIEVAAALGARAARVCGGDQPPAPETLDRAAAGLRELVAHGRAAGVAVVTENWKRLLATADAVNRILDAVGPELGLLADFGNFVGDGKHAELAAIMPRAVDSHAKCRFPEAGVMDADDFGRCLAVAAGAGFGGPYTLIYDGPDDDEWAAIHMEAAFVRDYLQASSARIRA